MLELRVPALLPHDSLRNNSSNSNGTNSSTNNSSSSSNNGTNNNGNAHLVKVPPLQPLSS